MSDTVTDDVRPSTDDNSKSAWLIPISLIAMFLAPVIWAGLQGHHPTWATAGIVTNWIGLTLAIVVAHRYDKYLQGDLPETNARTVFWIGSLIAILGICIVGIAVWIGPDSGSSSSVRVPSGFDTPSNYPLPTQAPFTSTPLTTTPVTTTEPAPTTTPLTSTAPRPTTTTTTRPVPPPVITTTTRPVPVQPPPAPPNVNQGPQDNLDPEPPPDDIIGETVAPPA